MYILKRSIQLMAMVILLSGCFSGVSQNQSLDSREQFITVSTPGKVPIFSSGRSETVFFVHNNADFDISDIRYFVRNSNQENSSRTTILIDSKSAHDCSLIKAGKSCTIKFTTPSGDIGAGSSIIVAQYNYNHQSFEYDTVVNYSYVGTTTEYGLHSFGLPKKPSSNGKSSVYETLYVYGGGEGIYTNLTASINSNRYRVVGSTIADGQEVYSNRQIVAFDVAASALNSSNDAISSHPLTDTLQNVNNIRSGRLSVSAIDSNFLYSLGLDITSNPIDGPILEMGDISPIDTNINSPSGSVAINIVNSGTQSATIIQNLTLPAGLQVVSQSPNNCANAGSIISVSSSCVVTVKNSEAGNSGSGQVVLKYQDTSGNQQPVASNSIYWYNSGSNPVVLVNITPNNLVFNSTTTESTTVVISNSGTSGFNLKNLQLGFNSVASSATVQPQNASLVGCSSGSSTTNLIPGGSCTYSVKFTDNTVTTNGTLQLKISAGYGASSLYTRYANIYYTTLAPQVAITMVSPANGESNVTIHRPQIKFQFNMPVTNVNTTTVTLRQSSSTGTIVPSNIATLANNTYTITPTTNLQLSTTYYVVFTNGITDSTGAYHLTSYSTNFVTGMGYSPTWMGGSSVVKQSGVYGTKGVPSLTNIPGARNRSVSWTDSSGNLWLFGGFGYDKNAKNGNLNDLWKYNPTTKQWVWMSGESVINQYGTYGTKGTSGSNNTPGARSDAVGFSDNLGNLWLFGGMGYDGGTTANFLNDLWKYNPATNQWTWVSGSNVAGQSSVYGTKGIPSATNMPGGRQAAVGWSDNSGNLWLFAGQGKISANDLWKYNIDSNQWTWVSGTNQTNQIGVYGTKGVANEANIPGPRQLAAAWSDNSGNLWLFGGNGNATSSSSRGNLNDLWKYNIITNQWTWMNGSNGLEQYGSYGTKGVGNATNTPGGRSASGYFISPTGDFYLVGGTGSNSTKQYASLSDVWKYNPVTNQWTWVAGADSTISQVGVYGTLGVYSASNIVPDKYAPIVWSDSSGKMWLFGGSGSSSTATSGIINDLWYLGIAN